MFQSVFYNNNCSANCLTIETEHLLKHKERQEKKNNLKALNLNTWSDTRTVNLIKCHEWKWWRNGLILETFPRSWKQDGTADITCLSKAKSTLIFENLHNLDFRSAEGNVMMFGQDLDCSCFHFLLSSFFLLLRTLKYIKRLTEVWWRTRNMSLFTR